MNNTPANRSAIACLYMADIPHRFSQQRQTVGDHIRTFQRPLSGASANGDVSLLIFDTGETRYIVNIDQHIRAGHPHRHQRH